MALYSSRLDKFTLPLILLKKGKGERVVYGHFSIATNSYIEPELFIPYLLPLANKVFIADTLEDISNKLVEDFKVTTVELGVEFGLAMDRLSELDFNEATTLYNAGYQCLRSKKKIKNYVWIDIPSVVRDIVPTIAKLLLVLGYKEKTPYFEDIIFAIEKVVVPINPVLTIEEKKALGDKLLNSKSGYGVISELLDFYQDNEYITSCALEVKYRSIAHNTDICHTVEVKKK